MGQNSAAIHAMRSAAERFRTQLENEPASFTHVPPVISPVGVRLNWSNLIISSPRIRRAHVEYFEVIDRVAVLHVCIFPHYCDPTPIFGFDMVAGHARVTGIFLDLSPVVLDCPSAGVAKLTRRLSGYSFSERRDLPEWASIFSSNMVAIRPSNDEEVACAIELAQCIFFDWIEELGAPATQLPIEPAGAGVHPSRIARSGQVRYCMAQRGNQHTYKMLGGFIGMPAARSFIDDVLFPID